MLLLLSKVIKLCNIFNTWISALPDMYYVRMMPEGECPRASVDISGVLQIMLHFWYSIPH